MPIYFLSPGTDSGELSDLENRIRTHIPDLQRFDSIEQLMAGLPRQPLGSGTEKKYVLLPIPQNDHASFERLADLTSKVRDYIFFILISEDISATDYKQLVRTGNAEWVSTRVAPQEIVDIIARHRRRAPAPEPAEGAKPAVAAFVPSAGGVGNSTIAMETAVQLKTSKATRTREICLIDLDFQTSHVCDLLDIEPRLQIEELSVHPERMDDQLFDLFLTHHSSGLDVLAAPRSKTASGELNIVALDALFGMISKRYQLVLVDLPVHWFGWTRQILEVADFAVVTGLVTIPSLRQVGETLKEIRNLERVPPQVVVALNRSRSRLLGGVAGRQFGKRMLANERIFYIREDAGAASQSVNTGIPMTVAGPRGKVSKDLAGLGAMLADLKATQPAAVA